VTFFTGWNF